MIRLLGRFTRYLHLAHCRDCRRMASDQALSAMVGRGLVLLGRRARDRGNEHEYAHALAALVAGNSENCHPQAGECSLDVVHVLP